MAKQNHRPPHHERPQPQSRQRSHPLLEKHKDYVLRSASHRQKQHKLKNLRAAAAARNPDEFSFRMLSAPREKRRGAENTGGVIGVRAGDERVGEEDALEGRVRREVEGGKGLRNETVRLLKGQDVGFVRVMRGRVSREVQRLRGGLRIEGGRSVGVLGGEGGENGGGGKGGGRGVFVETAGSRNVGKQEEDEKDEEVTAGMEMMMMDGNASARRQAKEKEEAMRDTRKLTQWRKKERAKLQTKLEALQTQDEELGKAERELDMQRARMQGDIGGVNKNGVKFKVRERKR